MAAILNWYQNQYRTRRFPVAPNLQPSMSNPGANLATPPRNGDVALNMGDLVDQEGKPNKDTLFGPSVGVVNSGPEWAKAAENPTKSEELTPEIVKHWIVKSKEQSEPTTTLQALVNLKRPTIRLLPLAAAADDGEDGEHHISHGLEFEFDCDAPKCAISMSVIGVTSADGITERMTVFETQIAGGFGRKLKLEEGAMLDLESLESAGRANQVAESVDAPDVSATTHEAHPPEPSTTPPNPTTPQVHKKRLTFFRRRSHGHNRPAAGPALAVVDAESTATPPQPVGVGKPKPEADDGIKVSIRLSALDEIGKDLNNHQVTYLHIVRLDAKVPNENEAEDTRPWMVKVVKREATIGLHTFHLHEIYGLTSHSSAQHPTAPIADTPNDAHTYPPGTPLVPANDASHEEDPTAECLLCLSSPREVVLLPCRHLVACRECAVNMIEFGAGGTLVHPEPEATASPDDANASGSSPTAEGNGSTSNDGTTGSEATPSVPVPAPPPSTQPRRKRKAKGWFCPVCRQPYTSLLRITTSAPPVKEKMEDAKRISSVSSQMEEPLDVAPTLPQTTETGNDGVRAPFIHAFTRGSPTLPPDLERGEPTS